MLNSINDRYTGEISIALDAMGGDFAPYSVISGADIALSSLLSKGCKVFFSVYGQADKVLPILSKYKKVESCSVFIDTPGVVCANDKPSIALRKRKDSSMRCAVDAIKSGAASGAVSSGNTGALMAISRYVLGTLPNIDRPAIASCFPSLKEDFVLLDLGANVECNADSLFQFAVMGDAFAKAILDNNSPRIALLNVGSEEIKGTETIRQAFSLLKQLGDSINFVGYIEARDIMLGSVDVVVADGFSGNIVLKTAECVFESIVSVVKDTISSSLVSKFAGLLLKSGLKRKLGRFNPEARNGAMFLGLNGVVVKSHGNADAFAFAHAIEVAVNAVRNNINDKIIQELSNIE